MALLGSALAIVEFMTVVIVVKEIQAFFLYIDIMGSVGQAQAARV